MVYKKAGAFYMRLMIIHPHLDVVGGSEILTQILIYELAKMGIDIMVLTRNRNVDRFPEKRNVKFKYFEQIGDKLTQEQILSRLLDIFFTISHAVKDFDPHAVLVMIQEPVYGVISKLISPKIGTAIYIHYPFEEELKPENLPRFISMYRFPTLYEGLFPFINLKMTNSNYTARALYKHFGLESNVVYPAVPWEYFEKEPDLNEEPENVIITVGRFVPQKRIDVLIDMFINKIRKEVPDSKLIVVGLKDPRYEDYYNSLVKKVEGTENIEFIDRALTPKEMIEFYKKAKLYVHMRIGEHFGMAPVEAMSQGAVPILPKKSGLAELITHGVHGYAYTSDDECLQYILKALKMPWNEFRILRRNAYVRALYFNPDRFAKDVYGYLSLITA